MARSRVTKCPKCGQFTPAKGTSCLYCGTELVGLFSVEDRKPETPPPRPAAPPANGERPERPSERVERPTERPSERTLPLKTGPTAAAPSPLKTEREPSETRSVARPAPDQRTATASQQRPTTVSGPNRPIGEETRTLRAQGGLRNTSSGAAPALHEEPRVLGSSTPRFTRQTDDRTHFLILESGDPVVLDPGKLFVMGRDQRAGLVLRAAGVSRQHCEIDWQGEPPRPVLCEVRSRFGTFLNGRLVPRENPQPLRDGDEIRLGPSLAIQYRWTPERMLRDEFQNASRDETREVRLPGASGYATPPPPVAPMPQAPLPPQLQALLQQQQQPQLPAMPPLQQPAPMPWRDERVVAAVAPPPQQDNGGPVEEGNLIQMPPGQLLESLYRQRRTGTLSLTSAQGSGELYVREGKATGITFAGVTGQEALQRVLGLTQGVYRFRPEVQRPAPPPEPPRPQPAVERGMGSGAFTRGYAAQVPPSAPVPQPMPQQPPLGYPAAAGAPLGYPGVGALGATLGYPGAAPPAPQQPPATMSYGAPPRGQAFQQQPPPQAFPAQPDEETKALITPIIATIQAANLTGEGLGSFGGESAAQLLRDGQLAAALEVSERVLELAQSSPPAEAAQARNALKAIMRGPHHVTRALELLQHGLAVRGPAWAAPQALRLLRLFDRDMPPGFEEALKALARL